ncbi:MAG: glycosyltransferase family 2 protein [Acidimicrobiales bacterium]|nr:glycosyltransferase family 2 protein [Acidimicrobiales bacterium]
MSAIVVNWNGADLLADCLDSLKSQRGLLQTIVVDNGSVDGSREIGLKFGVTWIQLPRNMGLAYAFNAGAEAASGTVLLFLNNDLAVPDGFIEAVATGIADPMLGALDVHHRDWHGTTPMHERNEFRAPRRILDHSSFIEAPSAVRAPCAFASGACFTINARTFETAGRWDAGFFAGWEDVDLSWRLRLLGYAVEYDPSLSIRHHVSASSGHAEGTKARTFAALTGRPRFALKHAPAHIAFLAIAQLVGGTIRDVRSRPLLAIRLRALLVTALELPALLRWRRRAYSASQTTPKAHWYAVAEASRSARSV